MDVYQGLALLTDAEAEQCLNRVVNGVVVQRPELQELLRSPEEMAAVTGRALPSVEDAALPDRPKALRAVLAQMAEDYTLRPRLEGALQAARPTRLEPVTTALVLAGIVFVLSVDINVQYEDEEGKRKLKVSVQKKPTADSILEKFFPFFQESGQT